MFLAKMLSPIFLIALVSPLISVIKIAMQIVKRRPLAIFSILGETCITAFVYVFFLFYTMLTKQIFESFNCQYIGQDTYLLASDTTIECYKGKHIPIMLVSVLFLALYTLGLPVSSAVAITLLRKRIAAELAGKRMPKVKGMLGFVYDGYEQNFLWWESVVMLRKAFVVAVIVFFCNDAYLQALFAAFVGLVSLVTQTSFMPFDNFSHDVIESVGLFLIVCTMGGSLAFSYIEGKVTKLTRDEILKNAIAVLLVGLNALFFVVVIICGIVYKVKHKLQRRKALPKVTPEANMKRGQRKQTGMKPVVVGGNSSSILEDALHL